jgi:putative tryptophan/tyrosine transport system substrate-binding protein
MSDMRRREFITLLGGAAAAWPLAASAQQSKMPVLGFLCSASAAGYASNVAALGKGLNEAGYVEKRNLLVEYRWADFHYDRLPALAADLVRRPVDVIYTTGSVVSALAAKAATANIPIVFVNGSDPVQHGLVASLNRPGGNVTGINFINSQLGPKRIQLLMQLNPKTAAIAVLVNPKNTNASDKSPRVGGPHHRRQNHCLECQHRAGIEGGIRQGRATARRCPARACRRAFQ